MVQEFVLILLGIVIAYLVPFFQDVVHGILSSPRSWRDIMRGIKNSWKGLLVVIVIAALIAFGLGKYDEVKNRAVIEAENIRNAQLIIDVSKAVKEANEPLLEELKALIEEIRQDRNERENNINR